MRCCVTLTVAVETPLNQLSLTVMYHSNGSVQLNFWIRIRLKLTQPINAVTYIRHATTATAMPNAATPAGHSSSTSACASATASR